MGTPKPIKYSYSRLDTYKQCAFRYFLKYIEGHYDKSGSVALEFGSLIHRTEEAIGNCIKDDLPIPYDELIATFAQTCTGLQEKYAKEFTEVDKSGRTYPDKINYYLNDGIYRLEKFMKANPDLEIVGTEVDFNFTAINNEIFRGSIDRVLRNKVTGQYILHDIKSYAVPLKDDGPSKRDPNLVTPLQFVVYCLAAKELYGIDPNDIVCYYDLPLCDMQQQAGTKGFITRGQVKLASIFKGIYDKDWKPTANTLCHWCEFCATNSAAKADTKYLCPYFCQWTREAPVFTNENDFEKTGGIEGYKDLLEAYHKANGIE